MSKVTKPAKISFRIDGTDRLVEVNNLSSTTTSKIKILLFQIRQSCIFEVRPFLFKVNYLKWQFETELKWSIQNLELCNGWILSQPLAQVLTYADPSTKEATCNEISTEGMWSLQEMMSHINILQLLSNKLLF